MAVVRDGRPLSPAELTLELIRAARALLDELEQVPPALWAAIDAAFELARVTGRMGRTF